MPTAQPPTKACHQCLQNRPLGEFRRQHRNESRLMNDYNFFHNRYERVQRRNTRLKGRDEAIAHFAMQLRYATDANRMLLLCRDMFARYGGVQGFAESWAILAKRARPGSKRALNFVVAVANLLKFAKDARPPVKELDDKDLEDELTVTVMRLIEDRPELVIEAAQRLGWQVSPPEASQAG